MTDKYEEFKEFVREKYFPNPTRWIGVFNDFEEECAKKEKEIEIKQIISYTMFNLNYYNLSIADQKKVRTAYNNLKKKDLIK